jgi:hypothetical protein
MIGPLAWFVWSVTVLVWVNGVLYRVVLRTTAAGVAAGSAWLAVPPIQPRDEPEVIEAKRRRAEAR